MSLFLAALIIYLLMQVDVAPGWYLLAFVAEIIAILGYFFAKNEGTLQFMLLLFVGGTATLLSYTIGMVLAVYDDGAMIIGTTTCITAAVVGAAYNYSHVKKADVTGLSKWMSTLGTIFIVMLLLSFFVQFSDMIYLLFSILGAVLFSMYLFWDMSRLERQQFSSPAKMAFRLYWDIYLIFAYVLRIGILLSRRR